MITKSELQLLPRLKIVSIDSLLVYEHFNPVRTRDLIHRISRDKVIINPILVGRVAQLKKYIVLDGVNRLEALKRLNIRYVTAQVVDYFDESHIKLFPNIHYFFVINSEILRKVRNTAADDWNPINKKQVNQLINQKKIIGYVRIENRYWSLGKYISAEQTVSLLNKVVHIYLGKVKFCRLSEAAKNLNKLPIEIGFCRFTAREIAELVRRGIMLNSGITRHVPSISCLQLNFPLSVLKSKGGLFIKNKELKKMFNNIITEQRYRYYSQPVFICNE